MGILPFIQHIYLHGKLYRNPSPFRLVSNGENHEVAMHPGVSGSRISTLIPTRPSSMRFESLPVELIADILGELDLEHLIKVSYLSRRLYAVAADPSLNPWRRPILRNLRSRSYESALKTLSVRLVVPRQNWIEILSLAPKEFLLFQATLPNLKAADWEECFNRRFLPGWRRWKADGTWKEAFMKFVFSPPMKVDSILKLHVRIF